MSMRMDLVDPADVGMSAERLADARAVMQRQFDEGRSPMLVAVVARHGKVVFAHAVGDQRRGGPPLTIDSVFPFASQTKPLTAAVIMCLVERGLVGISEPAAIHLPELAGANDAVMVHHLLTHTSGWTDDDHTAARDAKLEEAIACIPAGADPLTHILLWPGWDVPRRLPPGEVMQYCNFNYSLLGEIARRATGGTLDAAMRRFLFDPIGMTSSTVMVGEDLLPRLIERPSGIPYGPDDPDSAISFNDPVWASSDDGSSGVHGSAPDFVRFGQMILDGGMVGDTRVLSGDAVRVMTTDQIPGVSAEVLGLVRRDAMWAYGFALTGDEPLPLWRGGTALADTIRHGGAGGISGWIDPELGVVAAYFEVVTEIDEYHAPRSWAAHRFEDVINAAVLD